LIQWGNGVSSTVVGPKSITVPYTYNQVSSIGEYIISARATDARGAQGPVATTSFAVLGWTLIADPIAPFKAILVVVGSQGPDNIRVKIRNDDYYRVTIVDRDDDVRRRGNICGEVDRILVFALSGNGNNFFRISDATMTNNTVFDDNEVDRLWGDDGSDWFFANTLGDRGNVLDLILDRTGNELAEDIDK
jgi:hypothetical protein